MNQQNQIIAALRMARQAQSGIGHYKPDGALLGVTPRPAASIATVRLADAMVAISGEETRSYAPAVTSRPAGTTQTILSEVYAASRVAQAGARILPIKAAPEPVQHATEIAWYTRESRFAVVTAADFQEVDDGDDVPESALPVVDAQIALGDSASHAVRFRVSRKDQKAVTDEVLQFEIQRGIALGLAQLADKVILDALVAATPAAFSLAALAAKGARFAECRAVIGSAANGAEVGADGILRAGGVVGELTDQVTGTIAGIWSRSAIAVEEEIRVLIERRSTMGDLAVTVFANAQAVLPDPDAFWMIAA